jgi:hypothetical protein
MTRTIIKRVALTAGLAYANHLVIRLIMTRTIMGREV